MIEQTTLRDQLTAAFDSAPENEPETPATTETTEVVDTGDAAQIAQAAQAKIDRERDEKGRFAKAQADAKAQEAAATPPDLKDQPPAQQQPKQRPARPTTWKKDVLDKFWDNLDPDLAEYLVTREGQYASGVSTYKNEWERVKPISEAMQQFMPLLEQHKLDPATWITALGNAHRMLATGTPEQKAFYFQKLAQDYGVQLPQGSGQGGPNNAWAQELTSLRTELNNFKTAQERAEQQRVQTEIAKWSASKPHYEQVRETMARLLESGVATDLDSAYDKAVRLDDAVFQQVQADQAKAREEEQRRQAAEAVSRAKGKAISTPGTTPAGAGKAAAPKGLRAQLEAAAEGLGGARV